MIIGMIWAQECRAKMAQVWRMRGSEGMGCYPSPAHELAGDIKSVKQVSSKAGHRQPLDDEVRGSVVAGPVVAGVENPR
jgi:hypothetical protein